MLGVNLGKNKETENAADDYIRAMLEIGDFGDYLVINISSPNTSGLRSLQGASEMEQLITRIQQEKAKHANLKDKPLLVKIAPDLSATELEDVARISLETKIDGLVVNNTTVARPSTLKSEHKQETGGLSGLPLKNRSLDVLKEVYRLTDGKIKIISVGGIDSGDDIYLRLKAGASLVQLYTAMTFAGPGLVSKINDRLVDLLEKDGVQHISSIIGSDAKRADN
jgi:dihydroorotate dehydrogenase